MVWIGPYRSYDQQLSEISTENGKSVFVEWRYNEMNKSTQMDTMGEESSLEYRLVDQKNNVLHPWTNTGVNSVLRPNIVEDARRHFEKPYFYDGNTITSRIIPSRRPVDLSVVSGAKILLFGEVHDSDSTKIFLSKHLSELRGLDYTHMGLEMVPSRLQRNLDQFFRSGDIGDLSEVAAFLNTSWQYGNDGTGNVYLSLIIEAQKHGIRIVALDMNEHSDDQVVREKHIMQRLRGAIAHRSHKLFALMGRYHACSEDIRLQLRSTGIETISITTGFKGADDLVSKFAREAGVHREIFMIEASGYRFGGKTAPFDVLIHLPQLEENSGKIEKLRNMIDARLKSLSPAPR